MWRALRAGILFQHRSIESLVRELHRNPALPNVCGFDALALQGRPVTTVARHERSGKMQVVQQAAAMRDPIPNCWNFYRFLANVIELEKQWGEELRVTESYRTPT